MAHRKLFYKGATKSIYEGETGETLVMHFRDDPTPGQAAGSHTIKGKGVLNNRISEFIMSRLSAVGISTHLVSRLNMREQVIRTADVFSMRIVIRNTAGPELQKRLGLEENQRLPRPLIEFYLKDDKLGNPLVTEDHLNAFGWATPMDLDEIYPLAGRTNDFLFGMMAGVGFTLVEFSMEVGRVWDDDFSRMVIIDELNPDVLLLRDDRGGGNPSAEDAADGIELEDIHTELALRLGILAPSNSKPG
ncbi:MAG: phosphoribosylaminoimidazolesuccinocarboxamide synthase [Rhodobacteraceae bacterium]|nr:phosphoribosylaminoimidazolesuccinocarboxamide synthase [Paracoccaceae bacterium]